MQFNNDPEWLRRQAALEDGCNISVGSPQDLLNALVPAGQPKPILLDWQPIATAPKDGTFVLLRGDSEYITTPYRVQVGRWVPGYRDFWITFADDAFTDDGPEATHWAPLPW